jgi:CxxC motif-containing protein
VSATPGTATGPLPAEMVCIACPLGCRLTVGRSPSGELSVAGNRCPKGVAYAEEETLSPKRIVTAVVRTDSEVFPYAPVRTDVPLPRGLAAGLLQGLYARTVQLPIRVGDVLIEDVGGTGVKVFFTRNMPPTEVPSAGAALIASSGQMSSAPPRLERGPSKRRR